MTAFVIQGFQPVSESDPILVKLMKGVVATCVQSSEDSIAALYGLVQAGPLSTAGIAWDMIQRGDASAGGPGNAPLGSSNWAAAASSLTRLGLPNSAYGPGSPQVADLGTTLNNALGQGIPVLLGVPDAESQGRGLLDQLTGQPQDLGVYGHALDIVGYDPAHGAYVVADPNSQAAASGGFVEYTLKSLQAAGADSLVIPSGPPGPASGSHLMSLTTGGGGGNSGIDWGQLLAELAGGVGVDLPVGIVAGRVGTGTNALDVIGGAVATLWNFFNGTRPLKIAFGTLMIVFGLMVAFQNETKAVIVSGLQAGAALSS